MRAPPLALLFLAAGCAGTQGAGSTAPAPDPAPSAVVSAPGARGGAMLTREDGFMSAQVEWSPDRVWPLVVQAYADIGIPVDQIDNNTQMATATNQRVRRLMGKGLGTYFNCAGPYGNSANRDDVYLTVRTQVVRGQESGSIVRIGASAVAKSTTAANTVTQCGSNGALENLIAERIVARATG